jgi:hypothetical protein
MEDKSTQTPYKKKVRTRQEPNVEGTYYETNLPFREEKDGQIIEEKM